jgi:hypothetical protein
MEHNSKSTAHLDYINGSIEPGLKEVVVGPALHWPCHAWSMCSILDLLVKGNSGKLECPEENRMGI